MVDTVAQQTTTTEPVKPDSGAVETTGQTTTTETDATAQGLPEAFGTALAGLEPDNREWLEKQGFTMTPDGLAKLAKHVHAQDKLIGSSIRVPGKDATPEEREAFAKKMGRPDTAEGYDFAVPKDLPDDLPYDGERAAEFKAAAHKLGLNAQQAAGLHDWFVGNTVKLFGDQAKANSERSANDAKAATAELVKAWGPQDGVQFQSNLEFGHRLLTEAGDPEVMASLKARNLVGDDGLILDAPLARMFSKLGATLYKEGEVLKGDPARMNNPFADATSNMTDQMHLVRSNPDAARSLIAAAGKKPEDFGLTT